MWLVCIYIYRRSLLELWRNDNDIHYFWFVGSLGLAPPVNVALLGNDFRTPPVKLVAAFFAAAAVAAFATERPLKLVRGLVVAGIVFVGPAVDLAVVDRAESLRVKLKRLVAVSRIDPARANRPLFEFVLGTLGDGLMRVSGVTSAFFNGDIVLRATTK